MPRTCRQNFEEAMSFARKSVPQSEITRYIEFQKKMKADARGAGEFKFKKEGAKEEVKAEVKAEVEAEAEAAAEAPAEAAAEEAPKKKKKKKKKSPKTE